MEKAKKILKRICPEFYDLKIEGDEIRFFRKFFNEGQDFGGIEKTAPWKKIVRRYINYIEWGKYMQKECNEWGCD